MQVERTLPKADYKRPFNRLSVDNLSVPGSCWQRAPTPPSPGHCGLWTTVTDRLGMTVKVFFESGRNPQTNRDKWFIEDYFLP
jgi:hypothetical protein